MTHVVIVGAGFAGVRLARQLRNKKDIAITLINESADFKYYPAMYRAATGYKMATADISLEWAMLDISNVRLVVGKMKKLDDEARIITLEDGEQISYDFAALGLGCVTTFFEIEGLHEHAFGVKSVSEIHELRRHIHDKVLDTSKPEENYVIAGAGPTGVEMAGGLGRYIQKIAKRHKIKQHNVTIWLVEAGPRILPQVTVRGSKVVAKRLEKLGVNILADTKVQAETIHTLKTSAGNIKTNTVIWTAGTATNPFYIQQGTQFSFAERGKIRVNKHLEAMDRVYVFGDNAGTKYSGLALTAIKHANFVAKDIIARTSKKKRPRKFESMPASVVPVGKNWAIMKYGGVVMHGYIASLIRKFADFVGYSDVLGHSKAFSIWRSGENTEDICPTCTAK